MRRGCSFKTVESIARTLVSGVRVELTGASIGGCHGDDLRHTAATFLLAQGVDPHTIMETLGHSQISLS